MCLLCDYCIIRKWHTSVANFFSLHHAPFNFYQSWFIGQWSIDHVLKVKLCLLNAASFSKAETIDGFENMALRAFLHIVANN